MVGDFLRAQNNAVPIAGHIGIHFVSCISGLSENAVAEADVTLPDFSRPTMPS